MRTHQRAKIIFKVFSSLLILSVILLLTNVDLIFLNKLITLTSVLFALWLYIDEEVLQHQKYIKMSFLLGSIGLLINIIIYSITIHNKLSYAFFVGQLTIVFVPFQIVLRMCYLKLFKQEPRMVGMAGDFSEMTYSTILMVYILVVPLIIGELIKNIIQGFVL